MKRLLSISALIFAGSCLFTPLAFSENELDPIDPTETPGEGGEEDPLLDMTGVSAVGFSGTFDGASHNIEVSLSGDAADAVILYGESEADCTLPSSPTYTDAGNYTVYFKVSKEGYNELTGNATIDILRKDISIKANAKSKHIGFDDPTLDYTLEGEIVDGYPLTEISITRTEGETVGSYDIKLIANASSNPNYNITTENSQLLIEDHQLSETFTILTEATCGTEGLMAKKCTVAGCDAYGEQIEIEPTGDHQYDGATTIIKEKTCTEDGLIERVCTVCGSKQQKASPATGHSYNMDFTIDQPATCVVAGEKSIHCANCSERKDITAIEATGHLWDEGTVETAATCTTDGSIHFTCTQCDETKDETVEKLGHDFAEEFTIDLAATCTTNGSQSQHCQRIGCEERQNITVIEAAGHQWGEATTTLAPTCTLDGENEYTCSVCSAKKQESIAAIGHEFDKESTIDLEATCTTEGSQSHHCIHEGCESKNDIESIEALGHNLVSSEIQTEPTCTKQGKELFACTRCDFTEIHPIEALGHEFADTFTVDQKASCKADGSQSRHCIHKNCTAKVDDKVIPMGQHLWESEVVMIAPTCTKGGKMSHTCEACGTTEEYDVDMLGHDYDEEYTIDVEATCEKMGTKSKHCSRCTNKIQTTFIAALGHQEGERKRENTVEATCTEGGHYDEVTYCARCNKAMETTVKTIESLGHAYERSKEYITKPTCETEGLLYSTCIRCGDVKTETTEALGHNYAETFTVDKEPSCTELGIESKHCARCDAKSESRKIDALGHDWNKGDTTTAPTCLEMGILTQTCQRCALTKEIDLDSLGHDFADTLALDVETTCLKEGEMSKHCSRCDERKAITYLPMIAHVPGVLEKADIHPATCTTDGSYKEVIACQLCGTFLEETLKAGDPAKGHAWDEGTVNVAATCTEGGKITHICTSCGSVDIRDIEPLGHAFADTFTIDIPATCASEGLQSKHCTRCDFRGFESTLPITDHIPAAAVRENVVEAKCTVKGSYDSVVYCSTCKILLQKKNVIVDTLGHTWNEIIETKKATCTDNGVLTQTCKVCMITQTSIQNALGHDIDTFTVDVPATCGVEGSKSKHCHRCDVQEEITIIPAFEHSYDEGDTTKVPTCTGAGEKTYTCSLCGIQTTQKIKALGHEFDTMMIFAQPTCEKVGMKARSCKRCQAESNITMIPALGHQFTNDSTIVQEATCEEAGLSAKFCERCNLEIKTPFDSLGHQYADTFTTDVPATCTEEGLASKHCIRCESFIDQVSIAALGHLWDNGTITTQPTDSAYGEFTISCKHENCTETIHKQLDKLVALIPNEKGKLFDVNVEGYCNGEENVIGYTTNSNSGKPKWYKITFSEEAKKQGFIDLDWNEAPANEQFMIEVPAHCENGEYAAEVIFVNEDTIPSPAITLNFTVNLSQEFTVAIFRDVISLVNDGTKNFENIQWFHNGEAIEGANLPYYQEEGGLSGSYYAVINAGTEKEIRTCSRNNWYNALNMTPDVVITPNPIREVANIQLHNFTTNNHKITIYNDYGVILYDSTFEGDELSLPTLQLVAGQYIIKVDELSTKVIKK